jgi:hypothetical protein
MLRMDTSLKIQIDRKVFELHRLRSKFKVNNSRTVDNLKIKNKYLIFILIILFIYNSGFIPAKAAVEYDESLAVQALSRMKDLSIFDKTTESLDKIVNRAQFSKAMVIISGLHNVANAMNSTSSILDVQADSEFSGFINAAVEKGLMNVMADDKFYPMKEVTFAQACTIMVRALGYTNKDILGVWPMNYINMAEGLGLTKGIELGRDQGLTIGAAAIMLDRLLDTNIKPVTATSLEKNFHDQTGLFTEIVIWDNSNTSDKLQSNQVLTDKGVYNVLIQGINLELGSKYRVTLEDNKISKVFTKISSTEKKTVNSSFSQTQLSGYISYYYKGVKQSYENLKNVLNTNSTIILGYNMDKSGYEYGIIYDPEFSKPSTAVKGASGDVLFGRLAINDRDIIVKDGQVVDKSQINNGDIVYEVTDVFGQCKYILVSDDKIEGIITSIYPNKLYPVAVFIDNKKYEISTDLNLSIFTNLGLKDKVSAKLGYDGKIIDIDKIDYKSGPFVECIILGNSETSDNLSDNQILTDKGVFYNVSGVDFELGNTYSLVLDGDSIVQVEAALEKVSSIIVSRVMDSIITYNNDIGTNSISLPRIPYYFHGVKQDYNTIKNALETNSALVFAVNENNNGYKYGILYDPIYGSPRINDDLEGFYNINYDYKDVIYNVTDVWGQNPITVAVDNKITGLVTGVFPNRTYPTTIQVAGKSYDLSQYYNFSKTVYFNTGFRVTLILGYDGKVIDIY